MDLLANSDDDEIESGDPDDEEDLGDLGFQVGDYDSDEERQVAQERIRQAERDAREGDGSDIELGDESSRSGDDEEYRNDDSSKAVAMARGITSSWGVAAKARGQAITGGGGDSESEDYEPAAKKGSKKGKKGSKKGKKAARKEESSDDDEQQKESQGQSRTTDAKGRRRSTRGAAAAANYRMDVFQGRVTPPASPVRDVAMGDASGSGEGEPSDADTIDSNEALSGDEKEYALPASYKKQRGLRNSVLGIVGGMGIASSKRGPVDVGPGDDDESGQNVSDEVAAVAATASASRGRGGRSSQPRQGSGGDRNPTGLSGGSRRGAAASAVASDPQPAPASSSAVDLTAGVDGEMTIGKHKGKQFSEIVRDEPGYCRWVSSLKEPSGNMLPLSNYLTAIGFSGASAGRSGSAGKTSQGGSAAPFSGTFYLAF